MNCVRSLFTGGSQERFRADLVCGEVRKAIVRLANSTDNDLRQIACLLRETESKKSRVGGLSTQEIHGLAIASEAIRRTLGFSLYDVQLLGAAACLSGRLIEMQTGEGKTLVAGAAAIAAALCNRYVHVATTNDYLAKRDFQTVRSPLEFLEVSSGLLPEQTSLRESRPAYTCQVVYGPGYQFGFDYLYDQLTARRHHADQLGVQTVQAVHGIEWKTEIVQCQALHTVVIDEADSVLLDEAQTPLIMSFGEGEAENPRVLTLARMVALELIQNKHVRQEARISQVYVNQAGWSFAIAQRAKCLGMRLLRPWQKYIENALHAELLMHRNEHYVVQDEKVKIVDQHTGRIFDDRTWQAGLHQAIETKEGVAIQRGRLSQATITRQRYIRFYASICGMSGTLADAAEELQSTYGTPWRLIPPHRRNRRRIMPSRYFADWDAKLLAIVEDVRTVHQRGQPILVGTRTVRESMRVAAALRGAGIECIVLNGMQDAAEAEIVAQAGQAYSITVATNMAGRGTDIKLNDAAREAGGLHVIGTEPNPSPRVDRQLIGRSARQGDPGSAIFYISAEDELIMSRMPTLAKKMRGCAGANGEIRRSFQNEIAELQQNDERRQREVRKAMMESDLWMDSVRNSVWGSATA